MTEKQQHTTHSTDLPEQRQKLCGSRLPSSAMKGLGSTTPPGTGGAAKYDGDTYNDLEQTYGRMLSLIEVADLLKVDLLTPKRRREHVVRKLRRLEKRDGEQYLFSDGVSRNSQLFVSLSAIEKCMPWDPNSFAETHKRMKNQQLQLRKLKLRVKALEATVRRLEQGGASLTALATYSPQRRKEHRMNGQRYLERVTITGADDAVDPSVLAELSERYPFVEWGVLISKKREGLARYPSAFWQHTLESVSSSTSMQLASHLCGEDRRRALRGDYHAFEFNTSMKRIQLNGFGADDKAGLAVLASNFNRREFICQARTAAQLHDAQNIEIRNVLVLWDASGGRGMSPEAWPKVRTGNVGYAGGIGPRNVFGVLEELNGRGQPFWIDMESGVRVDDQFDLNLVEGVLSQAAAFVRDRSTE